MRALCVSPNFERLTNFPEKLCEYYAILRTTHRCTFNFPQSTTTAYGTVERNEV